MGPLPYPDVGNVVLLLLLLLLVMMLVIHWYRLFVSRLYPAPSWLSGGKRCKWPQNYFHHNKQWQPQTPPRLSSSVKLVLLFWLQISFKVKVWGWILQMILCLWDTKAVLAKEGDELELFMPRNNNLGYQEMIKHSWLRYGGCVLTEGGAQETDLG